jgi:PAS domain S-box-containing protein
LSEFITFRIGRLLFAIVTFCLLPDRALAQTVSVATLTSLSDVKALSAEEASEGRPVKVNATILFAHPSTGWFVHFLYDGTDGIYVKLKEWRGNLSAGDQVVLTGVTGPGDFAPIVTEATVELSGEESSMPELADPTSDELARGVYDSRWVGIEGTVRSVRWVDVHVVMELIRDNHRFSATVVGYTSETVPLNMIGSQLHVSGVYAPLFNRNRQLTGYHFYVPGREHVTQTGRSFGDPFELDIESVSGILGYGRAGGGNQRVRSIGTVELVVSDTVLFMSDGANGVRVETVEPHGLEAGDGADVVGFAELGDYSPVLRDCQIRKRSEAEAFDLVTPTIEAALLGSFEARLVSVSGRLVNQETRGELPILSLQESGHIFDVEMVGEMSGQPLSELLVGSYLQVTGVCVMEVDQGKNPVGFHIMVGDETGVRVLSEPSWWTVRNTVIVMVWLVGVVVLVVGWGVTLQRRVSNQTSIIQNEFDKKAALQRQYQNLFENANDVVFAMDEAGQFSELNKAGERLLGFSREKARQKTLAELVAEKDQGILQEMMDPDRKKTGERRAELRLDQLDGRVVDLEVSFRGIRENGRLLRFEAIARDLTERKKTGAKLEKTQKELMHASRQAGMAEVATGVLHNVGNVLNSVNVSGQTALELIKKFRLDPLSKVAALLNANKTQADFLSSDPKGQKLPDYLGQLSVQLVAERDSIQQELKSLLESVEHTKDIVAMQQAYAHTGGLRDSLSPSELVEDAIRLNSGALTRHEMTLVRKFSPTQKISVDRTRILQVLINLIRNSKYACDDSETEEKTLTIAIGPSPHGVRISVIDTGVGIPKENLTKIFAFGFTTRKEGHGFGLHSSALAAKEMGGELTGESDGMEKGAAFHLDLPICSQEETS